MQMIAKNWQSKFPLMVSMAAYILYQSCIRKLESGGASAMTYPT